MTQEETLALLDAFARAFNRHDEQALMSMMTADAVFDAPQGPEAYGTRYSGLEAVGKSFSVIWQNFPDASWNDAKHSAHGNRGFSEWTFRGTAPDGTKVEVRGCDLFVFRDGKIQRKDSFRKNRVR